MPRRGLDAPLCRVRQTPAETGSRWPPARAWPPPARGPEKRHVSARGDVVSSSEAARAAAHTRVREVAVAITAGISSPALVTASTSTPASKCLSAASCSTCRASRGWANSRRRLCSRISAVNTLYAACESAGVSSGSAATGRKCDAPVAATGRPFARPLAGPAEQPPRPSLRRRRSWRPPRRAGRGPKLARRVIKPGGEYNTDDGTGAGLKVVDQCRELLSPLSRDGDGFGADCRAFG